MRSVRRFWLPVALALGVHAALGIGAACRLTATHDEYWHLPVGLLNLKAGKFHYDNLNPPLCRALAAVPLLFTGARTGSTGADHDAMGWGDVFVKENHAQYDRAFALGRSVIVLLSVLGGLATACWARWLFGDAAGCLAALLWAFEPNLLAHGSLVTTDMGAAAFFVFTLFALWSFASRPGWTRAAAFGALLGLAQLAKFTSLILYPVSLALVAVDACWRPTESALGPAGKLAARKSPDPPTRNSKSRLFVQWGAAVLISLAVLNAGYLFRGSFSPLKSYDFHSATLRNVAQRLAAIGWIPVPFPRDYLEGLDHQRHVMEQKHPVYLDGTWSVDGFPHYYLWAMFYKLPHPLQFFVIATLLWLVIPGAVPRRPREQVFLLIPAIAMIAVAETSRMQLGIRYILPAIPFFVLFASQSAQWVDARAFPLRALTVTALSAWMLLSVRYHPEHLAYFNELAGGPVGGRAHLLDSNLDWGQDLGGLKRYLGERGIGKIGLAYFGTVPPSSLGIDYEIPPSRIPRPGRFAVSVNFEEGRPHWVRTPKGEIRPVDIGEFAYFSAFSPIARIGASIDVFELSERDVEEFRARGRPGGR